MTPAFDFFSDVKRRNLRADGTVDDLGLLRRMQHPLCLQCQERYRTKFPDRPFQIVCSGIYDDEDFLELSEATGLEFEEVRELLDASFWAERHIRLANEDGDMVPFQARWYQEHILRCSSRRAVDRCGRGTGKTALGCITELHKAVTRKNFPIVIACPAKAQAKKWYDDILQHCENDWELGQSLSKTQQQPYYMLKFKNGSTISIYTTGSESGKEANTLRGVSPRRIRLDEQDQLQEGDYKAIMPLLRRFKDTEFHGSSTPTGKRETYWSMCTQFQDYQEFHFPITVHPDWGTDSMNEEVLRREARTEDNWLHEFLAEFGDLSQGVFKQVFIDASKKPYKYSSITAPVPGCAYYLGVDWNGKGTGSRLRVVEFNKSTRIRRVVDMLTVVESTEATLDAIRAMNRKWKCEGVMTDYGFGFVQDELLRKMGVEATDAQDRKLKDVQVIDFGASLAFNALVPRVKNLRYVNSEENEVERRTKPFIVEGAVMCLERGLFEFSEQDSLLEEQLRAYKVKTWSAHGYANTYDGGKFGDHDLDALMLALLGIEKRYGYLEEKPRPVSHAVAYLPSIGAAATPINSKQPPAQSLRDVARQASGVPSRQVGSSNSTARLAYLSRQMAIVSPPSSGGGGRAGSASRMPGGGVGSRTAMFRNPTGPPAHRNNQSNFRRAPR